MEKKELNYFEMYELIEENPLDPRTFRPMSRAQGIQLKNIVDPEGYKALFGELPAPEPETQLVQGEAREIVLKAA